VGVRQVKFCDISGVEDGVESHEVQLDQMRIEIDLAPGEYDKLLSALRPYLDAGRIEASIPDGAAFGHHRESTRASSSTGLTVEERQELREWAEERGMELPPNNRFKRSLVEEWRAATDPDHTPDPDADSDSDLEFDYSDPEQQA
jgi:hypothetical protein